MLSVMEFVVSWIRQTYGHVKKILFFMILFVLPLLFWPVEKPHDIYGLQWVLLVTMIYGLTGVLGWGRNLSLAATWTLSLIFIAKGHTLDIWTLGALGTMAVSSLVADFCIASMRPTKMLSSNEPARTGITNRAIAARHTYANVIGMSELKESMLMAGQEIIKNKGSRNGILLHGDPGNGKTYFAEALAGELKLRFISVSFGDMASKWVGQTTERAMTIFNDTEAQAPCVLFIDEVDSVFIDRASVLNGDSEAPMTLNAVLTRMVKLRDKGVVLVAATNFVDKLDPASVREGRFDFKVEVPPPDFEARKGILQSVFQKIPANRIDADGLERAAKRWEGYSVSRIQAIGEEAVQRMKAGKIGCLTFDDLAECLRKIQGTMGDRLPEDTPTLNELVLDPLMRDRLAGISFRMMNIEQIESMGGSVPNGVLFYGPPGTGKTLGARALAKTTGWAFLKVSSQELINNPDSIDKMLKRAKDIRPCIVFIDEADDILADRRMSPMSKAATNRLITAMDGAGGKVKDVLYVAATNAPDIIDEAALRGGRFTEKVEFGLPGESAVSEFVRRWMDEAKAPIGECITVSRVTEELIGQSLANIKEILKLAVNEAIIRMTKGDATKVTITDVLVGIKQVNGEY